MVTKKTIIAIFSIAMVMAVTMLPTFAIYQQDEVNLAYGNNERNTLYQSTSRYETFVYPYAQPFWSEEDGADFAQTSWVYVPTPNIFSMYAPSAQDTISNSSGEYDRQAMSFIPRLEYHYIPSGVVGGSTPTLDKTVQLWELYQWDLTDEGYEVRQRLTQYNAVALDGTFTPYFSITNVRGGLSIRYELRCYRKLTNTDYIDGTFVMRGTINVNEGSSFSLENVLQGACLAYGNITITASSSPSGTPIWDVTDTIMPLYDSEGYVRSYIEDMLVLAIHGGNGTLAIDENGRHIVTNGTRYVDVNVPQYSGQPNLLGFITTGLDGFFGLEFFDGWTLGTVFGIIVVVALMVWILKVVAGG